MAKKNNGPLPPGRRCRSYYGFSRNYPGESPRDAYRRSENKKQHRRDILIRCTKALGFVCLFVAAYFLTTLALDISHRPIPAETQPSLPPDETQQTEPAPVPVNDEPLRAVYLPDRLLASGLDAFLEQAAGNQINAVVIDFKRADGTLAYPSALPQMEQVKAAQQPVASLAEAVAKCREKGMQVLARVYCFRDPLAAKELEGGAAAVHYGDTDGLWLDNRAESGGKPWLNPYADAARGYLTDLIAEIRAFGADRILLDGVQFPEAYSLAKATFPGEKGSAVGRRATLMSFIALAQDAAGGDDRVILTLTGNGALNGDAQLYDGSLLDSSAPLVAPDLRFFTLPATVKINEQAFAAPSTKQVEFITAATQQLAARASLGGRSIGLMPILQADASTQATLADQLGALDAVGIDSYLLYNETGNYPSIPQAAE